MRPVPSGHTVDLWWVDTSVITLSSAELADLDAGEGERAASFLFPADRHRYQGAHVMLRQVLAGYSGVAPGELAFRREPCPRCGGPSGRPALVPAHQAPSAAGAHRPAPAPGSRAGAMPWFSLAHSGDMVLIAVAGRPVGADVEREAAGCVCSLAGVLHEADATVLAGLVEPARHEAVITCWVWYFEMESFTVPGPFATCDG